VPSQPRMRTIRRCRARLAALAVSRFINEHGVPPTSLQVGVALGMSERTARRRLADARTLGLIVEGPWPANMPLPGSPA